MMRKTGGIRHHHDATAVVATATRLLHQRIAKGGKSVGVRLRHIDEV